MATKSISQLDTQATANETDLFEVAIVDANSASGHASKKESAAVIADAIVGEYQYPLRITGTTAKTIAGAINELKNLVDLLPQFSIEVVNTLPVSDISETTIYLVPASDPEQGNYYEEYIYVNNAWELVGTTAVDLSGYYTSAQVDTLLAAKANTSSLATVATSGAYSDLSGKPTIDTALDTTSTNAVENRAVASEINSIKSDITVEGNASGDIATFVDGSDNPLRELKISIVATQSGTGDPSPTNVRPISGWTGANIYKKGFNIWDEEWELGIYDLSTGGKVDNTSNIRCKNLIPINPAFQLCWYNALSDVIRFVYYDKDKQRISTNATTKTSPYVFTIPSNARYMSFYYGATTYSGGLCISYYPPTNNEYVAHDTNSETINIDWQSTAGTVYGGTLDVKTGELIVTHGNIAEYDGETINEPWISSMDKYVAGATPTTGAQVVYPLTTPITYQLTPTEIRSLLGQNNIWADCGEITELKYTRDLNLCINDIISRIEALKGGSSNRSLSVSPVLTKSLTSELDEAENKAEEDTKETEEETKEEAQNER